jgi:hypothetical protein
MIMNSNWLGIQSSILFTSITIFLFMSLAIILFTPGAYALNILETTHPLLSTKTYDVSGAASIKTTSNSGNVPVPTARSVYETGSISLPASVSGFIIYIPDEAHHSISEHKTISLKNAHFIPSNLTVPAGTSLVYMHGDPNHIHIEILKDAKSGQTVWQTVPIKHPGSSDAKVLPIGTYAVTDQKYKNMTGTINVSGKEKASSNNLVAGGMFVPTSLLPKYRTDLLAAKFRVLSTYDFVSKTVQKDINGPTTLIIYSTTLPIKDATAALNPIVASLPYR